MCKIIFVKEHKIDYIVINKDNDWIEDFDLPVDGILKLNNEKCEILRLKW